MRQRQGCSQLFCYAHIFILTSTCTCEYTCAWEKEKKQWSFRRKNLYINEKIRKKKEKKKERQKKEEKEKKKKGGVAEFLATLTRQLENNHGLNQRRLNSILLS